MSRRTARGNRMGLAIVGLLLLIAGLLILARSLNLAPGILGSPDAPVAEQRTRNFAAEQTWFWVVLAIVLILIALLALRWLAVQTRSDALGRLRLESDPRRGATTMPAGAATGALEDDLSGSPYLRRASATLNGSASRPRLKVAATMAPSAEVGAVRSRLIEALGRYGQAMEAPDPPTTVHLRVGR
jgi:HAMP domain-containing protein